MFKWGVGLLVGLVLLAAVAWDAGQRNKEEVPRRQPSEAERIIAYCKAQENRESPLCRVDPNDPDAVRDAVRDTIERQTTGPQIIERERVVEDDDDDSDTSDSPDVRVIVPTARPTTPPRSSAPRPTPRPSLLPELPEVPEVPMPPNLDLPLLP